MEPSRAPLFSVSLAFATGCVLGLDGWINLRAALVLAVVAGALWCLLRRRERASLAAFYALVPLHRPRAHPADHAQHRTR
ncbi:MAG: hypothetical protein WDO13_17190 [Verrucomicrobiota bacterium]